MSTHYQVVIAGGGNAGISVAAQLRRSNSSIQVVVIDPSDKHYYQPAFTLVGSGIYDIGNTVRSERSVIPDGVEWIQQRITNLQPDQNTLLLENGAHIMPVVHCLPVMVNWCWLNLIMIINQQKHFHLIRQKRDGLCIC